MPLNVNGVEMKSGKFNFAEVKETRLKLKQLYVLLNVLDFVIVQINNAKCN